MDYIFVTTAWLFRIYLCLENLSERYYYCLGSYSWWNFFEPKREDA